MVNTAETVFISRGDGVDGRAIDCIYVPDKTIIELADYIRSRTN